MTTVSDKENEFQHKLEELQHQLKERNDAYNKLYEKYESAVGTANDGLWVYNSQTGEIVASGPWKEILGIASEDIQTPQILKDLVHIDDKPWVLKACDDFIESNSTFYNRQFRMIHADGSFRWIHCRATAVRDENDKILVMSGFHTDITSRKISAELSRRPTVKFHTLYENSLVAMFRMNIDTGEIIDSNNKLKSILESDQIIGDSFYNYISSEQEKEIFQKKLNATKGIESLELQLKTAKGESLWVIFSGAYYNEEHQVDCVLKDITQTKENLLELQKVNFELDSFVYHASHDLRSPLRSVLGLIDLYRMEQNKDIREECIEKIENSIKRLDLLVMDLLSISRNDRVDEPLREINLMNEVSSSVASYYNASNTKDLEIITKIHQPVKFISDLTRVRIILNNLISNAIKYRSFHKGHSFITIDVKVNKEQALIKIEDNGEGIEESKLPHIFDMFYRATEKSEGSGLGLYIVKKVADKLNAKIEVNSVELEGTTFTVFIPNLNKKEFDTQ